VKRQTQLRWAEELDVSCDVMDFEKKVPAMAKTWPFKLDTFQKKVCYQQWCLYDMSIYLCMCTCSIFYSSKYD
jgi:hypothetical protein